MSLSRNAIVLVRRVGLRNSGEIHSDMPLRIMVSRHSVFYSPLISVIAQADFSNRRGLTAEYSVLSKGQRSSALLHDGVVDIMQSAVSSNWKPLEQGQSPLPVHFAQINQRDGFFLVGREREPVFEWKKLAGKSVLADHAPQPLAMLKFAARSNGAEWARIDAIDAGSPEEMARAFQRGPRRLRAPAIPRRASTGVRWGGLHSVFRGRFHAARGLQQPLLYAELCFHREFSNLRGGVPRGARMGSLGSIRRGSPCRGRILSRVFARCPVGGHQTLPDFRLLGGWNRHPTRPLRAGLGRVFGRWQHRQPPPLRPGMHDGRVKAGCTASVSIWYNSSDEEDP